MSRQQKFWKNEYMHEQIWYMHWMEVGPTWVLILYAFWKCKSVILGRGSPEQISWHTVSPRTCLKESGQVRRYNEQVPLSRGNYRLPLPALHPVVHFALLPVYYVEQQAKLLWNYYNSCFFTKINANRHA